MKFKKLTSIILSFAIITLCSANLLIKSDEYSTMSNVYADEINIGDANNDGNVNVRDCAFIALKLAQNKSDELTLNSDYNGDNSINVRDAAAIANYLATKNSDQYASYNYLKILNTSRQNEIIKNASVEISYNGVTNTYKVDNNGYITIPIQNNNWDVSIISGSDEDNHVLYEHKILKEYLVQKSDKVFEYPLTWGDGDTIYYPWGYDSLYSAKTNVSVNHVYDSFLYADSDAKIILGITAVGEDISSQYEHVVGLGESTIPAFDKGEYKISVVYANGFDVKLSTDTFTAGNSETIDIELTPVHKLTVTKKVNGEIVNASFTIVKLSLYEENIKRKSYNVDGSYTFEIFPYAEYKLIDNETNKEYFIVALSDNLEIILTYGDETIYDYVEAPPSDDDVIYIF